MAHQLHFNDATGKHSFFSVKEKAWHGLGTIVDQYPSSREALQFAGLDYTVEKRAIFTYDNENQNADDETGIKIPEIQVPDYFATIRTDNETVLGVVGKDYEIVQNVDAFSFFDSIVDGEGIMYETAGALGKGERIFITAKLPGYIRVGNDDCLEKYLFLTTSHDGFGSIMAAFTPIRICCNNTLNAALRNNTGAIKIRHTANAKERLEQAHKLMGISNRLSAEMEEIFNQWTKVTVSDKQIKSLIQQTLVPNKEALAALQAGKNDECSTYYQNMCDSAFTYAMVNDTQQLETTRGTLFGAYNGITGYFQNVRKYKDDTAKMKSVLYGGLAQQRGQVAFDLCNSFAKGELILN